MVPNTDVEELTTICEASTQEGLKHVFGQFQRFIIRCRNSLMPVHIDLHTRVLRTGWGSSCDGHMVEHVFLEASGTVGICAANVELVSALLIGTMTIILAVSFVLIHQDEARLFSTKDLAA